METSENGIFFPMGTLGGLLSEKSSPDIGFFGTKNHSLINEEIW